MTHNRNSYVFRYSVYGRLETCPPEHNTAISKQAPASANRAEATGASAERMRSAARPWPRGTATRRRLPPNALRRLRALRGRLEAKRQHTRCAPPKCKRRWSASCVSSVVSLGLVRYRQQCSIASAKIVPQRRERARRAAFLVDRQRFSAAGRRGGHRRAASECRTLGRYLRHNVGRESFAARGENQADDGAPGAPMDGTGL